MSLRRVAVGILATILAAACSGGPTSPGDTDAGARSTLVFRAAPLDEGAIKQIIPLGNLNPPGHTFPTDHIYVNHRRPGEPPPPSIPVYAPGDGQVQFILRSGVEAKIGVRVGSYTYYLGHVELDPSIREGATLSAGQRIGQTGSLTYGIDLGVFNTEKRVFFVNPARYPPETANGEAPLRFYEEPLRSRLYALVQTVASDRDGRFDYDTTGVLAGNWFLEGLSVAESGSAAAWPRHLAFVYDNYDPSAIRVSIGGTLSMVGAFAVQASAPDPKTVSPASGMIAYRLLRGGAPGDPPGSQLGLLIVQMLDSVRIKVEAFTGSQASDADFTGAARIYVR